MLYLYQFINQLQLLIYYGKNVSLPIEVKQKLQSCTDDKKPLIAWGWSGTKTGLIPSHGKKFPDPTTGNPSKIQNWQQISLIADIDQLKISTEINTLS